MRDSVITRDIGTEFDRLKMEVAGTAYVRGRGTRLRLDQILSQLFCPWEGDRKKLGSTTGKRDRTSANPLETERPNLIGSRLSV